jgi:putative acetyltransferase
MDMKIRRERENEYRAVEELTREAFWNLNFPGCVEHYCLHVMRDHPDFIPELDFVVEHDEKVIGNIVYARGRIIDAAGTSHQIVGFGPISVLPAYQRQGVGSALIKHSLEKAASLGFTAVLIYGDPRYYHRFGFRCAEKYDITTADGKYAVALMALELAPGTLGKLAGRFVESEAYHVDEDAFEKYEAAFPPGEKAVTDSQREFEVLASLVY